MEMRAVQLEKPWHGLAIKDVLKILSSSPNGLSQDEAELRLEKYGKNEFKAEERFRFFRLLFRQIKSPLVFILIIAGFATLFFKAYTDSIVIFIAVTINTAIGLFQEGKASQAFAKLKDSQKKYSTVKRASKKLQILAENIIPGDILILSAGDQVGADARLINCKGLEINESVLTGEWVASSKNSRKIKENATVADMANMIFKGTLVTAGWAEAIVVATGISTEVGKIAEMIRVQDIGLTSFQKNVKGIARLLSVVVLVALVLIFGIGLLRGQEVSKMLFMSVAIAVAAIPEGLPVVVSVVLAIGMERILRRGGLVKRLNATETLGSVDVILTDKTGTLTQAIMRVSDIVTIDSLLFPKEKDGRREVLEAAILSSDAFIENPEDNLADWTVRGRPVEQALVMAGVELGLYQHKLFKEQPRIDYLPFESERRYGVSLNNFKKNRFRVFISGSPEHILGLSNKFYRKGRLTRLIKKHRELLLNKLKQQTRQGARVIATAFKDTKLKELPRDGEDIFEDLVFGGFVIFHDPLRPDVQKALYKAKMAGVETVMVTGDHKETARKIAEEVGISSALGGKQKVVTGDMIEKLSDEDLKTLVDKTSVYARVLPHQKLRIVKAWQSMGKTVAMTGDGINDAPALRSAEVGIALDSGTEVAKEASEIVLLNNSFSVIISAIEEGRRILINLRKILVYLLSTGFSEIVLIGSSLAIGLPLPILPAQILWTNLIEEGFMNFAFAFEPKEKGIMKIPPSSFSAQTLLDKNSKKLIILLGFITSAFLVGLFLLLYSFFDYSIEYTRMVVFGALSLDSIFYAFSLKSLKKPIWKINIFSNMYLVLAILISFSFLIGALFIPQLRYLLSLAKPDMVAILIILFMGLLNLVFIEITKYFLIFKGEEKGL